MKLEKIPVYRVNLTVWDFVSPFSFEVLYD